MLSIVGVGLSTLGLALGIALIIGIVALNIKWSIESKQRIENADKDLAELKAIIARRVQRRC